MLQAESGAAGQAAAAKKMPPKIPVRPGTHPQHLPDQQ
jgi:hypothetical protein